MGQQLLALVNCRTPSPTTIKATGGRDRYGLVSQSSTAYLDTPHGDLVVIYTPKAKPDSARRVTAFFDEPSGLKSKAAVKCFGEINPMARAGLAVLLKEQRSPCLFVQAEKFGGKTGSVINFEETILNGTDGKMLIAALEALLVKVAESRDTHAATGDEVEVMFVDGATGRWLKLAIDLGLRADKIGLIIEQLANIEGCPFLLMELRSGKSINEAIVSRSTPEV